MFKRKESFFECGNSPSAWHNLRVQPDDKVACISCPPHASRGDLAPLFLPTPCSPTLFLAAGSTCHFGVKQGPKKKKKKKLSAELGVELAHSRIRDMPELVQRRGGSCRQKQRREEKDHTFGWQGSVWPPQLCCASASSSGVHSVGCKSRLALKRAG